LNTEHVVGKVLEAALNPAEWRNALRVVAEASAADYGTAHFVTPDQAAAFISRDDDELFDDFVNGGWCRDNTRMDRGIALTRQGVNAILTDWNCFTPEEIARSPFEQEFAAKHKNIHYVGRIVPRPDGTFFVVTVERSPSRGRYMNGELEEVGSMLNAITSALNYAFKAQIDVGKGIVGSLDGDGKAHAWITSAGRLVHASARFEGLVGSAIQIRSGRVHAIDRDADEKLQWLIAHVAAGLSTTVSVSLGQTDDFKVTARALPLCGAVSDFHGAADVLLSIEVTTPRDKTLPEMLRARYGLTPAEIRLAMRIGRGETPRQAAEEEGLSIETVRSRLKVVFHKTATNRQTGLALLMQRLLAERAGQRNP